MQKLTNSIRSLCGKQTAPDSTVYLSTKGWFTRHRIYQGDFV